MLVGRLGAVEKMLQSLGTFQELMDKMAFAKDSEKDDVFQAELRKRLLGGLAQHG